MNLIYLHLKGHVFIFFLYVDGVIVILCLLGFGCADVVRKEGKLGKGWGG